MLCPACESIFEKPEWASSASFHDSHSTYSSEVRDGKRNGCQLCYMLCSHFDVNEPAEELNLEYLIIDSQCMRKSLDFWYTNSKGTRDGTARGDVHFVVLQQEDIASYLPSNRDTVIPNTVDTQWQVLSWVRDCLDNHESCNRNSSNVPWYPKRLLKIESGDTSTKVRVVVTADTSLGLKDRYLTLSHRWGDARFLKLTFENLTKLQEGFQLKDLPKTFRDVFTVAKWLNVLYVWIDSLCIIQNSVEDWEEEAGRMSQVYQHALCNIAATGAINSAGGLFFDRNPEFARPFIVSPAALDGKSLCVLEKDFWANSIDQSPLIQRAWVVQERALARRVIHFAKDQIFWECRQHAACETWPNGFMHELKSPYGSKIKQAFQDRLSNASLTWGAMVDSYSRAQLTFPGDKEAALNGIITILSEAFNDTCIAGLWQSQITTQLEWSSNGLAKHCAIYRAPSWSWLSIDGEVKIDPWMKPRLLAIKNTSINLEEIEIIDINVQRYGTKPFSPITSAYIKLLGRPRRVKCHQKASGTYDSQLGCEFHFAFDGIVARNIHATLDNTIDRFNDSTVWLLPIFQHEYNRWNSAEIEFFARGLILRMHEVRSQGAEFETYERIGIFHTSESGLDKLLGSHMPERLKEAELREASTEDGKTFKLHKFDKLSEDDLNALIAPWEENERRVILLI